MVSAPALVTISGCSAVHLLGEEQLPLISSADLSLNELHGDTSTPPLLLTLGTTLAFPLDDKTLIGTQTGNGTVYLLRPHLAGVEGPQGWIRLELPDTAAEEGSEVNAKRDEFERILVQHGFLLGNNVRAGADEVAAEIKSTGISASDAIKDQIASYKATHDAAYAPASFSRSTHSRAAQASSVTHTAAEYAKKAASVIGGASFVVGETIAKTFSFGQKSEAEKSETRKTLEDVGRAFEDVDEQLKLGRSEVTDTAGSGLKETIGHGYGTEAADLTANATATAGNVAAIAGAGLVGTSVVFHGARAAAGAASADLEAKKQTEP